MYCTFCQANAPLVNQLFELIKQQKLDGTLKLAGVGAGNSDYEVGVFRKKYNIAFPLLPDADFAAHEALGKPRTPFFLLLKLAGQAGPLPREEIYQVGQLKPLDSRIKVAVGQTAPDFSLPAVGGGKVGLGQYRGQKNVVLSFVPAARTPVCSEQWLGYSLAREEFAERDTVILGITTDNVPTLHAWTQAMGGVWFPVLSDFWPHGAVAGLYGILRGDGVSERAPLLIDKAGVLRYIDVHDINKRPDLGVLIREIDKLK